MGTGCCGLGKGLGRACHMTKKCTTLDMRNMCYLVTLQKIRTIQKFQGEPEYLRSFAEKTFKKTSKDYCL